MTNTELVYAATAAVIGIILTGLGLIAAVVKTALSLQQGMYSMREELLAKITSLSHKVDLLEVRWSTEQQHDAD